MARLVPCARCSRHIRIDEHACPFCRGAVFRRSLQTAIVVASTVIAAPALADVDAGDAGIEDAGSWSSPDYERTVIALYGMPPEPRSGCSCDVPAAPLPPAAALAVIALAAAALARRRRRDA